MKFLPALANSCLFIYPFRDVFLAWAAGACRYANGTEGNLPNGHLMNRNIIIFQ